MEILKMDLLQNMSCWLCKKSNSVMAKDRDTIDIDIVHIPVSWYIIEVYWYE